MGCGYRPGPVQPDGLPLAAQEEIRRYPRPHQPRVNRLVPAVASGTMGQTLTRAGESHCRTGERAGVFRNLEAFVGDGVTYSATEEGSPARPLSQRLARALQGCPLPADRSDRKR